MTKLIFVRHAESDIRIHQDELRPLTQKGLNDRTLLTELFKDESIDCFYSSPYKRSTDTVALLAKEKKLEINTHIDLRERKIGNKWIDNFNDFAEKQWKNFDYKLESGESLGEVQRRNLNAIAHILKVEKNKTIVIGTHGTAMSTILNHYDSDFNFKEFNRIKGIMPIVFTLEFDKNEFIRYNETNVFEK